MSTLRTSPFSTEFKKSENIIVITEKKDSILFNITKKFNLFFIEHKNYIGGRYSVLSEVGMVPAELMGLNEKKFKRLNYLIKNKTFINFLIENVTSIHSNIIKGKKNCVILNYDEKLNNFLKWYQQLSAESLGKKGKGFFPIISTMPIGIVEIIGKKPLPFFPKLSADNCWYHFKKLFNFSS